MFNGNGNMQGEEAGALGGLSGLGDMFGGGGIIGGIGDMYGGVGGQAGMT